jgi:NAD(P)-dependent dehydrogenase (short-subunit alcohol dehydrogenase family)
MSECPANFNDKVVVVTGGAQGIGWACAEHFLKRGAKVVCADILTDKADEKIAQLPGEQKDNALSIAVDVSKEGDVQAMIDRAVEKFGRIDVMVSNAGIIHKSSFLDLELKDFQKVIDVNLTGVFLCGQKAAKAMLKQRENGIDDGLDSIINMSSVNAVLAIPEITPYIVSKGGINQLTKVMAISLSNESIRVNAVGPGSIATDMLKVAMADEKARHSVLSRTPLGRAGEPSEIASVVGFLASKEASYITGQTIYADGGRMGLNYVVPVKE